MFSKHHQLRTHMAETHFPKGTKPFICEHSECTKSFISAQKLRAHSKTHEGSFLFSSIFKITSANIRTERRYTCSHSACEAVYFPTWTALQAHTRTAHPAICPYPTCKGKTFSQQKGLRAHLKIHKQREVEESLIASIRTEDGDADDESEHRMAKRRRGGEVGRDSICESEGCGRDFKSVSILCIYLVALRVNIMSTEKGT